MVSSKPAGSVDALDIVGRVRDLDLVGIHRLGHPVDGVELGEGALASFAVTLRRAARLGDVHDEEAHVEPAGAHLLEAHLAVGVQRIDCGGREIEFDVVVRVDRQDALVDRVRPGLEIGLGRGCPLRRAARGERRE